MSTIRVAQLMSQPAVICTAEDTLHRAAQLMWDHDCGALPVVDAAGRTIGVVTDRDCCMAAYTQGRPLHEIPVGSAMSKEAYCCRGEDAVDAAERTMSEKQVRRVPVVDEAGRPLGLLSLNDVARESVHPRNRNTSLAHDVASTLARICEPHKVELAATAGPLAAAAGRAS